MKCKIDPGGSICFVIPLPPSKNKRRVLWRHGNRVIPKVSPAVEAYREEVGYLLKRYAGVFKDGIKVVMECVWHKSRATQDCANWHDELLDAVCPAIGINDRFVLLRDMDYVIEPKDPRVAVCAYTLHAVND